MATGTSKPIMPLVTHFVAMNGYVQCVPDVLIGYGFGVMCRGSEAPQSTARGNGWFNWDHDYGDPDGDGVGKGWQEDFNDL